MHQTLRKIPTHGRKKYDKYYTKSHVVQKCLRSIDLNAYDLVIEPSAGNGAFFHAIKHENKVGMDILPEHADLKKKDWLRYCIDPTYKRVLVIGNPPFGQYHALSKAFLRHAFAFPNVQTVAFILPNVYKKHTRQHIVPRQWRIKEVVDVGKNAFLVGTEDFHIDSSFFVIDKSLGDDLRSPSFAGIYETEDFLITNKENFDIFVFGASPKRVITSPTSKNRGYFLKSKIPVKALIHKIKQVDW